MLASDGVAFFLGLPISGASSFWWEGKSRVVGGIAREQVRALRGRMVARGASTVRPSPRGEKVALHPSNGSAAGSPSSVHSLTVRSSPAGATTPSPRLALPLLWDYCNARRFF